MLATNSGPLGDSITQLADASQQLSTLFGPNLQPLQGDVGTITQVGRTLDRNLSSLDQGLSSAVALFSAAGRAYDPTYNWLNLNNQLAPGVTGTVLAGLVRDRLAGICRRVLANHASGLSTGDVQTLQSCGNPASGYFDPLLSIIPSLLAGTDTASSASTPSAQQLITRGLGQIPGLSSAQRATVAQLPPSSLATPSTTTPATSTLGGGLQLPVQAPVTDQQANNGGLLGGLVHGVLGVGHFFGSIL